MNLSKERLLAEAAATEFRPDTLEKAGRLLSLLTALRSHPFLKERLALKGGTALNLFVFDVPRLSVDIDVNYIGSSDKAVMEGERPFVDPDFGRLAVAERGKLKLELSLDDIEEVQGYIAAEANHTKNKNVQRQLDLICEKLQRFLDDYDDQEE